MDSGSSFKDLYSIGNSPCNLQPTKAQPNCNIVHEIDMHLNFPIEHLGKGGRREALKLPLEFIDANKGETRNIVIKSNRHGDITEKTLDYNRRDAIVAEHLTSSQYAIDVYGFCGDTQLLELAESDFFNWKEIQNVTSQKLLYFAQRAAMALADLHAVRFEGMHGVMIHRDVRPWNFLVTFDHRLKIHDFNAGRFLPFDKYTKELCPWKTKSKCNQVRNFDI